MASLHELQKDFTAAILAAGQAEETLLDRLLESPQVGRQRLAAYRRSIVGRWIDALEATYPVVTTLVGRPFLREAARRYAQDTVSVSGDLNAYGETFADFLDRYPYAADLPYLGDVARLEWRIQAVASGPEATPVALKELARFGAADWPLLVFGIAPNHARVDSRWPVAAIWRQHQGAAEDVAALDLSSACQTLVWREDVRVMVIELGPAQAALFDALTRGEALGLALEQAAALDASFDPGPFLHGLADAQLLCSARIAEE